MKATFESMGELEKVFSAHIAISGQVFWQSKTAGFSWGQHGMPSGIASMDIDTSETAAAIAGPVTALVNGPAMSPTTARIGSSLRSQMLIFMACNMSQA